MISTQARPPDIQRVWLRSSVGLAHAGRRSRATLTRSEIGIGHDRIYGYWKECALLRVYEAYEFCLMLHAPPSEKSAERPSEGGFEGIGKVFAPIRLGATAASSQGHALARPA